MAIITISRQIAALGDQISEALADALQYTYADKNLLEERLAQYGVTREKLEKYDEKKPGFWASLTKDRDEYLHYLKTAIYEYAVGGNCVFMGRGAFAILAGVPGVVKVRLIAPLDVRTRRTRKLYHCGEKQAAQIVARSDADRAGFHQSFFNINAEDAAHYHLALNTGLLTVGASVSMIKNALAQTVTSDDETEGEKLLAKTLAAQKAVNKILFDDGLPIYFLETSIRGGTIVLHGVASSAAVIEQALAVARSEIKECEVESAISIVRDFKSYP